MRVAELVSRIRSELARSVDEDFRAGVIRFFREPVDPWGVRSPDLKRVARMAYAEVKPRPLQDRIDLCTELWKSGKIEEAAIAIELSRRFAKQYGAAEFRLFESWIDRYVHNWANCDGVASWLLAACIANEPRLIGKLRAWTASANRWKRRASIVALLQEAKQGRSTQAILAMAGALLDDADDMVRKGVGWVLKETYPKRPRDTVQFLITRAARTPRLVLRLAAEKMTPADRARVLRRTGGFACPA